jgi:hypothetical protein
MDRRKPRSFTRRVGYLLLVEHPDSKGDDPDEDHQEQRKHERCLDQRLAMLPAASARHQ